MKNQNKINFLVSDVWLPQAIDNERQKNAYVRLKFFDCFGVMSTDGPSVIADTIGVWGGSSMLLLSIIASSGIAKELYVKKNRSVGQSLRKWSKLRQRCMWMGWFSTTGHTIPHSVASVKK